MKTHTPFEMRLVVHRMLRIVLRSRASLGIAFHCLQEIDGLLKILFDIAPEMEDASGLKDSGDLEEEVAVHDASFPMPLLPPWIGEVNVDLCDGRVGNGIPKDLVCVGTEHERVREIRYGQSSRGEARVLERQFDPKKVHFGPGLGCVRQE